MYSAFEVLDDDQAQLENEEERAAVIPGIRAFIGPQFEEVYMYGVFHMTKFKNCEYLHLLSLYFDLVEVKLIVIIKKLIC